MDFNIQEFILSSTVMFLLIYSIYLWISLFIRRRANSARNANAQPTPATPVSIDHAESAPEAFIPQTIASRTAPESDSVQTAPIYLTALSVSVWWVGLNFTMQILHDLGSIEASVPTLDVVKSTCLLNLGIWVLVLSLLTEMGRRPISLWGGNFPPTNADVEIGVKAFVLSLLPVLLALLITYPFRSEENQHSFLQLLRDDQTPTTFLWMFVAAAILAPLNEELIFRVILQGWLSQHLSRHAAVILVAVIFSAVHGWPDAVPLLPLALILGYTYDAHRCYSAVVLAHALFNALNLFLAFSEA
ncbi:MAG: lysostaphin resistance A-like protein [Planctomycetaceae bacterium]